MPAHTVRPQPPRPTAVWRSRSTHAARLAIGLAACAGLLTGCAFGPSADGDGGGPPRLPRPSVTASGESGPPTVVASVLARGLDVPWGITFLPDGAALVTERDNANIIRVGPEDSPNGLRTGLAQKITEAVPDGEGGLLGIAASPTYKKDKLLFIYYSTATDNRIAKLVLGSRPTPIVTGIPHGKVHNGGQLRFGPDGFLYASTGDAGNPDTAQDLNSLAGKILRLTKDGKPAPGNPFPRSLVFSYGHRNVEGLDWDGSRHLFATEFGQNKADELNLIKPGANYGWPATEGPTAQGSAGNPGYTDPILHWNPVEASCAGLAIQARTAVLACLRGTRLWLARLTNSGTVLGAPSDAFVGTYGRLRAAATAPDGSIWVTTSNKDGRGTPRDGDDKILRIVVAGSSGIGKT